MRLLFTLALFLAAGSAFATPTTLTTVTLSETAALFAESSGDNTNGNQIKNPNCDLFLLFKNSHVSDSATATVVATGVLANVSGIGAMTKANATVTLTTGQQKHLGPFRCKGWNDSSGYVQITFSGLASSSVKVTPLRLPTTF